MPASAADVYAWHARSGAIERLTPPWDGIRVVERTGGLEDGTRVTLSVPFGPIRLRWVARHRDCRPGQGFVDEQVEGPFASWVHTHLMRDEGEPGASILDDHIEYTAPAGAAGRAAASFVLPQRLKAMFRYRHDTLRADLASHTAHASRPRMTVAITGASGLIGSALRTFLTTGGHRVIRLVRSRADAPDTAGWDPARGLTEPSRLPPLDAVVHLAGESIAGGRWTEARKAAIRESRVGGTARLAESIARLDPPPASLLCASAIGFYQHREGELTEADGPGTGFLAEVGQAWEAAGNAVLSRGIRLVHLRLGLVLSPAGGMLRVLKPLFTAGLGGPVGSGRQVLSWVAIDDVVGAFHHALMNDAVSGPVNVTAPAPVSNREFGATLGRVLGRPAVLPAPAFAVRVVMGSELADETALSGAHVVPARLQSSGYAFRYPALEAALRHVLGRQLETPAR